MATLIGVKRIEFNRAEGRTGECGPHTFFSWKDVNGHVRHAARTAPDDGGGYDKCDVAIVWADGTTYKFRFDMTFAHHAMVNPVSHDCALDLAWHTGIMAAPDNANDIERAAAIRNFDENYPGARQRAERLLHGGYDLGGVA